jgi:hypothetical protein
MRRHDPIGIERRQPVQSRQHLAALRRYLTSLQEWDLALAERRAAASK